MTKEDDPNPSKRARLEPADASSSSVAVQSADLASAGDSAADESPTMTEITFAIGVRSHLLRSPAHPSSIPPRSRAAETRARPAAPRPSTTLPGSDLKLVSMRAKCGIELRRA